MYGTVTIGGKDVEMVANAASPYRFKQIFREDFLKRAIDTNGNETESVDLFDFLTLAESITLDEVEALFRSCFAEERTVLVSLSPADASSHD